MFITVVFIVGGTTTTAWVFVGINPPEGDVLADVAINIKLGPICGTSTFVAMIIRIRVMARIISWDPPIKSIW